MATKNCESCLMPLAKDPGKSGSDRYCSYCFKNGDFVYKGGDVKEFQKHCYDGMVAKGMSPVTAWFFSFMVRFAPRWKS